MGHIDPSVASAWFAGLTLCALAAGWTARKTSKLFRKADQVLTDFQGREARPGVEAVPGVMLSLATLRANQELFAAEMLQTKTEVKTALDLHTENTAKALEASEARTAAYHADVDQRLQTMAEQLAAVHHESQTNEGSSMKDQLNRLDPKYDGPANDPKPRRPAN